MQISVHAKLQLPRVLAVALEPRACLARWDAQQARLTLWLGSQSPSRAQADVAGVLGLALAQVRVICPDVGGGFGAKINLQADEALLPWVSRKLGRPVRWAETRGESMVSMPHGRAQIDKIEIGGRRDGTVEAYRLTVLQDVGAYPSMGAFLPFMTRTMAPGTYVIPKVECNIKSVMTNTTPIEAYRGAGRPEATAAIKPAR